MKEEVEVGRGKMKKVQRGNGNSENYHVEENYVHSAVFIKWDDN